VLSTSLVNEIPHKDELSRTDGVRDDYHGVRDNQFVTIHLCEAFSSRPVYRDHDNEHGVRADYHGGRDNLYRVRDNSSM